MKKILIILLTLTIITTTVFAIDTTPFTDVVGTEYYANAATILSNMKIITGYEDGSFGANRTITRAEMATIICRMLGKEKEAEQLKNSSIFDDVSAKHWAIGYINFATNEKIINGDGNGKFRPEDYVKYEEAVKMVVCALGYGDIINVNKNDWSAGYIEFAENNGFLSNVLGNKKNVAMFRSDIAVLVYNGINKRNTDENPILKEATFTEQSIKTSELNKFGYLLYTPKNATDNMPLIIYLHGGSGKGDDLSILINDGFPKYVSEKQLGDISAYVIIPQLPSNLKGWTDAKNSLKELIQYVSDTYKIDSNKISLTGHSMGGTGTWGVATAFPEIFSCIAPMSGSIKNTEENIKALSNMPVWAFVGSSDTIVNPSSSEQFIELLKTKNSNAQITIFDGATHFDVPSLAYLDKNIDIVNWLISHSK